MKILIIKPSGIGDIVHSFPVAIGLKILYPECDLHWLVFSKFKDILHKFEYVDKIIPWDRNGGIKEYIRLLHELKQQNYDLIIDLQVLMRTAILGFLVKYRRVISTSFVRECTNIFVSPVDKFNPELHAVERNYQVVEFLAKKVNKTVPKPIDLLPWIKVNNEDSVIAKKMINYDETKKYVVFSIGSRGWHKIWPEENFVKLINALVYNYSNIIPVFVGSKEEMYIADKIVEGLNSKNYFNLVGRTNLYELCSVLNLASITVSNDNGIAHISAALDKPTVILFGPTNPKWFYPYNTKSGFIYKKLKCSPCGIKTNCKNNVCMKEITVEDVLQIINKILR